MPKSTHLEYVLLGCATSNLATVAYPFVVVVSKSANQGCTLESYVLNGWQNIRDFFTDDVREDVLLFLDSLTDYAPGDESHRFFAQLANLSVGPIRTMASGACDYGELDRAIAAILDAGQAPIHWPESFTVVE